MFETTTDHVPASNSVKILTKVPPLRFPEFIGDWEQMILSNIATFLKGKNISKIDIVEDGVFECIRYGELYTHYSEVITEIKSKTNLEKKDLVLSKVNDIMIPASGETQIDIARASCILKENVALGGDLNIIRTDFNGVFLAYYLSSAKKFEIAKLAQGNSVVHLYSGQLRNLKLNLPSDKQEQQKIASFLTAVDTKIQQLTKKRELLEQYKKGVMQKIFSREIRFKDKNGNDYPDWEERKLGDLFERVTRKNKENNLNVLTISAQHGLINQKDYFNHSVSAKDLTNYYLLKQGEFAYNKSYSKGYPMGAIKRLDFYEKGVVSTLYICFKPKGNDDSFFYQEFFESGGLNSELHKIAQEGARNHGLLNMSIIDFFKGVRIIRPSIEEQQTIGKFLYFLSEKIKYVTLEIENTQRFKKGLMQQMFV